MAAIDMSILKIYIKMHSTSFFFFTSKKVLNMSLRYVESVVERSCISITNFLSVPSPPISHMHHSQSFDKIDSFLKPVLNILILCNLIVVWGEGVNKEGAGILHQIYRFRGV